MSTILFTFVYFLKKIFLLTGYMNNQVYPKPLTPEEELKYLILLEEGNEFVKESAKHKLVEHNLRLVAHIAKKYENTGQETEELNSIGVVGLIKGIDSYTRDKGTKLATYAAKCIENEILMHLRKQKKTNKDVSLHDSIGSDKDGNDMMLIDVIHAEVDDFADVVQRASELEKVMDLLSILEPRELEVIKQRFGIDQDAPKTQLEIANGLNISRSYVSRIEKRALTRMYHEHIRREKKSRDSKLQANKEKEREKDK